MLHSGTVAGFRGHPAETFQSLISPSTDDRLRLPHILVLGNVHLSIHAYAMCVLHTVSVMLSCGSSIRVASLCRFDGCAFCALVHVADLPTRIRLGKTVSGF